MNKVTADNITEMQREAQQAGITGNALTTLTSVMQILSNTNINCSQQITELMRLAAAAGIAIEASQAASTANRVATGKSLSIGDLKYMDYNGGEKQLAVNVGQKIMNQIFLLVLK